MTDRLLLSITIGAMLVQIAFGAWAVWDAYQNISSIPVFTTESSL